jgi:23S rRNA pseudouridine955/2504/2580 synthase/23S rRNA pseudouridine1911/1915/1917 synthase
VKDKIQILFEDDDVLMANKPTGVTVIPDRFGKYISLQGVLEKEYGKLFIVHRIDRDTSGLICFAKNEHAHRHISMQFQNHEVKKIYKAVVKGRMANKSGIIESPIAENPAKPGSMMVSKRGKAAISLWQVDEAFRQTSVLDVEIKTGRTHQIRVHLASIGHPLLVDELYGNAPAFFFSSLKRNYKPSGEEERPTIARLTLHAYQLTLLHPTTNQPITVSAPLPKDLETLLKLLRKYDL